VIVPSEFIGKTVSCCRMLGSSAAFMPIEFRHETYKQKFDPSEN
jgi:hypothetical protein